MVAGLVKDIDGFLAFKRALGHPYRRGELTLRSFRRFVEREAPAGSRIPLETIVKRWLSRAGGRQPVTIGLELGVIRQLCLFHRRHDPRTPVPDRALAPVVTSSFTPYIFSKEEIHRILNAVELYPCRNVSVTMVRALILILYCTGLRLGEAVHLRSADIDFERQIFFIRESKGRSRFVPFRADLAREVHTYLAERNHVMDQAGDTGHDRVFLRRNGKPLSVKTASQAIRRILQKAGIKPPGGRRGPRPYEFRHAFAVHRLTEWYRRGVDIHTKLPWLSAYMGHVDVLGTEVYLAATPELLQLASRRFEQRFHTARKTP